MSFFVDPKVGDPSTLALRTHPNCVVCGRENPQGFHMRFTPTEDGSVVCRFDCSRTLEGYPKQLHGGVIASLLDGAMTHCLFLQGYTGVTVELKIRYRHPVKTDRTAIVRGWMERNSSRLHLLKAEVIQDGAVKVTASGKFMNQPRPVEGDLEMSKS
jgi:acyl-coenzyme A thioesterase PaaI-like protein